MNPPLTIVLFVLFWCWPISLLISFIGLIKERSEWLILGAILYLPMALYLSATPKFKGYPLLFPLFLVGASVALKKDKNGSCLAIISSSICIYYLGVGGLFAGTLTSS